MGYVISTCKTLFILLSIIPIYGSFMYAKMMNDMYNYKRLQLYDSICTINDCSIKLERITVPNGSSTINYQFRFILQLNIDDTFYNSKAIYDNRMTNDFCVQKGVRCYYLKNNISSTLATDVEEYLDECTRFRDKAALYIVILAILCIIFIANTKLIIRDLNCIINGILGEIRDTISDIRDELQNFSKCANQLHTYYTFSRNVLGLSIMLIITLNFMYITYQNIYSHYFPLFLVISTWLTFLSLFALCSWCKNFHEGNAEVGHNIVLIDIVTDA